METNDHVAVREAERWLLQSGAMQSEEVWDHRSGASKTLPVHFGRTGGGDPQSRHSLMRLVYLICATFVWQGALVETADGLLIGRLTRDLSPLERAALADITGALWLGDGVFGSTKVLGMVYSTCEALHICACCLEQHCLFLRTIRLCHCSLSLSPPLSSPCRLY
jgi:hypothetical protein